MPNGQPSDTAVQYANQVQSLVQQLKNMRSQIAEILKVNSANPLASQFWNVLNTTTLNADGTIGAADGSPNTAHKIDNRVYPGINRLMSATNLSDALQILVDLNTFCDGTQVNANASRPAQIDAVAM